MAMIFNQGAAQGRQITCALATMLTAAEGARELSHAVCL